MIKNKNIKTGIIGALVIISYFFLSYFESIPLEIIGINIAEMGQNSKIIYMFIYECITMLIICFLLKDKIKKDLKDIKKNHKKYFESCMKYWLLAIGVMMLSNLVINSISTKGMANNQANLETLFKISPIYMFFSAVIYAPIVEELTFRQGIRNLFKNNLLFILISGILFGSLHVVTSFENIVDLLYIIPYSAPGIAFAYMLTKYNNIFVSMGFHFMHNGILMALQFALLILG